MNRGKIVLLGIISLLLFIGVIVNAEEAILPFSTRTQEVKATILIKDDTAGKGFYETEVSNLPEDLEDFNRCYASWSAHPYLNIKYETEYQSTLYLSYYNGLPDYLQHANWSRINYVINHKINDLIQMQFVIWYLLDFEPPYPEPYPDGPTEINAMGWALLDDAKNNPNYLPTSGELIAIICDCGETCKPTILQTKIPSYTPTQDIIPNIYDVDQNKRVDFIDAGLVWNHRTSIAPYNVLYDVNLDGSVDYVDAGLTWINRD
jgi:hypothetical protein